MSLVNSGEIKNLSIALEALSRINHPASGNMFEAVEQLLDTAISVARKENNDRYRAEASTIADNHDDIPF